jgi:hypothetical protein
VILQQLVVVCGPRNLLDMYWPVLQVKGIVSKRGSWEGWKLESCAYLSGNKRNEVYVTHSCTGTVKTNQLSVVVTAAITIYTVLFETKKLTQHRKVIYFFGAKVESL